MPVPAIKQIQNPTGNTMILKLCVLIVSLDSNAANALELSYQTYFRISRTNGDNSYLAVKLQQ